MADNKTVKQRSDNMRRIMAENTKPELAVREYLHKHGFRYRLYRKNLPGKPDLVFTKYRKVIFINGCFWHGHKNCPKYRKPKSNTDYWEKKIENNIKRDKENITKLKEMGWGVYVIWECGLKREKRAKTLEKTEKYIKKRIS